MVARELVVQCFLQAQQETFRRASERMGRAPSDDELAKMIEGAVRLAFRSTKGDFDHPTKKTLMAAVQQLAAKAAAMGTPPDVIEDHRSELGRLFAAMPDEA
jgi:hypothetical protein